ncbi:MAG: hypothetical protein M3Q81_05340 [bacterium]|nr:hypothetical protein [bacterium]
MPRENDRFDATSDYRQVIERTLTSLFPHIRKDASPADESVRRYIDRADTHVSFDLPSGPIRRDITAELVGRALAHGTDPQDSAFSAHAFEHKVASSVVERLRLQLDKDPTQVTVQVQQGVFETGNPATYTTYQKYVVKALPVERNIVRPLFAEVGEQLGKILQDNIKRPDFANSASKKAITQLAREIGVDFAVLVAISAGVQPDRVMEIFNDPNLRKDLPKRPTGSRGDDLPTMRRLYHTLWPTAQHLTYDSENLGSAMETAAMKNEWGHAAPDFMGQLAFPYQVSSLAVLGGADFVAARIASQKSLRFLNPARQDFFENHTRATSQLITAYNTYERIGGNNLVKPDSIKQFIADRS